MSEQMGEQNSGETGSFSAGPAIPSSLNAPSDPVAALVKPSTPESGGVDSPKLAVEQADAVEPAKADASSADAPKVDAPKVEAAKAEAPRAPGKVMIMSAGDRAGPKAAEGMFGARRLAALAAVVALAAIAGALGGAVATAGFGHFLGRDAATSSNQALEASVARIDADIQALKASIDQTAEANTTQFNRTNGRLDKVEKAQAEPAAKLARLSEAVDKLRAVPLAATAAAAAPPAAAKDVTGSIAAPASAPPAANAKPEVARLPTVEGWRLRDVANGAALIEGRRGMFEVYAGDPIPGLGRVDAIRRQDGRWVVVTAKGLIVAR